DEKEADEEKKNASGNGDDTKPAAPRSKADFGWKTSKKDDGRLMVSEVYAGRAAYKAGVNAGDELVALDGTRADEEQVKRIERDVPPGTSVAVSLFRRARLLTIPVPLGSRRAFTWDIKPRKEATEGEKKLFSAWLGQPFPKEKEKAKDEKPAPAKAASKKKK